MRGAHGEDVLAGGDAVRLSPEIPQAGDDGVDAVSVRRDVDPAWADAAIAAFQAAGVALVPGTGLPLRRPLSLLLPPSPTPTATAFAASFGAARR